MRGIGFEPMKALSQQITRVIDLSLPRLTASIPSHKKTNNIAYKKLYKSSKTPNFETAIVCWKYSVSIPNLKVKQHTFLVLVS